MNADQLHAALRQLATNLRWTWNHRMAALLGRIPGADPTRHPLAAIDALTDEQLAGLLADEVVVATVAEQLTELEAEMATAVESPEVVYFSPEFGITELVPQYSGGLGILAGDHLKSASDVGLSFGAVGLFYRQGFFRQALERGGQVERSET